MKAKRSPRRISSGAVLPSYWRSLGLGSKRSSWDGPPSMKRTITFLARGLKCGPTGRAASGAARAPRVRLWSATDPSPSPVPSRKWRRVSAGIRGSRSLIGSILGERFIEIEQHVPDQRPGREIRRRDAGGWTDFAGARDLAGHLLPAPEALLPRCEELLQSVELRRRRRPGSAQTERPGESGAGAAARFLQGAARQAGGHLEVRRVVQRRQRLQRRVRARALHDAHLAAGRVERGEGRVDRRPPPVGVQGAAVA